MRAIAMAPNGPGRGEGPASVKTPGFQAKIKDASLADLVQMECMAGSRSVVRVVSGDSTGYLYFRGGSVVHAITPGSSGEKAAIEMLCWEGGTFEPAEREWPTKDTISCSGQTLLLRAAQARDEMQATRSGVSRRDADGRRAPRKVDPIPIGESIEVAVSPVVVAGHSLRDEDFQVVIRMSRDGAVLESRGGTPEFADIAAYALRLSQLVGEQLGLERFMGMECAFKQGRCFIVLEDGGDVVVLEPYPAVDPSPLREMLGI